MKIVQITTDSRVHFRQHDRPEPYFGTAPAGLFEGFRLFDDVELHVISCSPVPMRAPAKLGRNIWFHQPVVGKLGWGRTLFSGCVRATRKLIRDIQPDIVHGQGTERDCSLSAVLSGFPNVLTIHGNMKVHAAREENRRSFYYKMAAALEGFCLHRTDGVVAISTYTQDLVSPFARRTWLLPNAVDRRFFEVNLHAPELPRILFVGGLDQRKNPLGLLRSCAELLKAGKCTLALAGQFYADQPYGREVMALAKSLPGLEFLGFLDRDALTAEFGRSSLLVLPTFEDNCPMVVLEAMAAGLPVAASRVGGVPDLVQAGKTGILFNPEVTHEITEALRCLVDDAELRGKFGRAGMSHAQKFFHPETIARKHLEIYREVLGERMNPSRNQ